MIDIQGFSKLYEDHLAVDNISVRIGKGQICGLVGPNGAGKTTTLRCMAGLIPATAGKLQIAGCSLPGQADELKKHLAYVPDDPPLFDDLTVGQHLDLIGRLYRVENHRVKANELLDSFGLTTKIDAGATTLSRGMRQKLAVCCAYLFDPDVLLLDEPLTGLDPPGIRMLLASVRQRATAGTTIVISSHLLAMIDDIITHLMVMQEGSVQYFGSAEELRARYRSAKTLEEAYFAATTNSVEEGLLDSVQAISSESLAQAIQDQTNQVVSP